MITESADVDFPDPAYRKETPYVVSTFNGTSIYYNMIVTTHPVPVREITMTLLPHIIGATVGVFVMCVMGVFTVLFIVLMKKKLQKKDVSNRAQNIYSECPHTAAPIYEMVLGNFDLAADNKNQWFEFGQ